jgi:solute carrier family 25 phosphate transporter 3
MPSPLSSNKERRPTISPARYIAASINEKSFVAAAPIELYSTNYFLTCALGGALACGPTHSLVTPLDLVKCRSQVKPGVYKSTFNAWATIYKGEGLRGVFTGIGPTAIGYSLQGTAKYGFYEYFKYQYGQLVGDEAAHKYRTALYLAASASAEFLADIALCPWEALKVRMQTSIPPFATNTAEGFNKLRAAEGLGGFYKGLVPLWGRQIPYTMMKFASFERVVELIYANFLSKPKESYNKFQQLQVSFAGGYIAGILCASVSHPADVLVSKLNNKAKSGNSPGVGALIKELGWNGLWRGLSQRIVMIGTLTALQWLFYDSFKGKIR